MNIEEQIKEQQKIQQQFQQLESIVKQYLTKEAIARYGNIKTAHPEVAVKVITVLANGIQAGELTEKISDEEFKDILKQLTQKKEFKIKRK